MFHSAMTQQRENIKEKHFGNAGPVIRMQFLALCCHSQSDEMANLKTIFFQTGDYRVSSVLNVFCAALQEMNVAFLLTSWQR